MKESNTVDATKPPAFIAKELFALAQRYFDAFVYLGNDKELSASHPRFYLLFHSLELSFKSYISARGASNQKIIDLRHDLKKLLRESQKNGLIDIKDLADLVKHLRLRCVGNEFRYPFDLEVGVPFPNDCIRIMSELLAFVKSEVYLAVLDAELDFAAQMRPHRGKKVRWRPATKP